MAPLISIRLSDDKLEIVNQLLLPHITEFIEINSVEDAHDAIKSMKIRGAPAIASLAALSLSQHLRRALKASPPPEFLASPEALKTHVDGILAFLYTARPTAVNLGAATRRLSKTLDNAIAAGKDPRAIAEDLIAEGNAVADEDVGRNKEMSKWAGEWLVERVRKLTPDAAPQGLNVLTVCNTGSLATSGYGTALGMITYLHETGKLKLAYYTQTAPYHQGSRLTALELQTLKIPSVMICDTMVGSLFQNHNIHAVGMHVAALQTFIWRFINLAIQQSLVPIELLEMEIPRIKRIGTYNAAVLAARHRIPFIVVAPISTVDLDIPDGTHIPIEQRPPLEACLVRGVLYPNDGETKQVQVMITPTGLEGIYNPSFDVTPAELITAIVTEKGVAVKAEDAFLTFALTTIMTISYIAVHGGAGFHGTKYEKEIKQALRRHDLPTVLCSKAPVTNTIVHPDGERGPDSSSSSSLSMVEDAICVLEDEQHLNAGYGSNLTTDGTVECDASIMSAQGGYFGSVGAVSGIKNPIRLAKAILENSRIPNKFGRVAPLALVSGGAQTFAMNAGNIEVVPPDALVSPTARATWEKWKARMDAPEDISSILDENNPEESLQNIQDTVGAIAFSPESGLAAGVSSGGLLMKHPGRVGEVMEMFCIQSSPLLKSDLGRDFWSRVLGGPESNVFRD
ncbi:hypothetical protein CVT26_010116 [Gymnopilus dilepis]|uniref:Uncharacterized protein n=1 Tax=Gymnopilus dilepis TaxID=231916 RepID=A0A409YS55_9AGAR|nr:hypothetical protein CVT26_010116 [Gymnopilus dilepis]